MRYFLLFKLTPILCIWLICSVYQTSCSASSRSSSDEPASEVGYQFYNIACATVKEWENKPELLSSARKGEPDAVVVAYKVEVPEKRIEFLRGLLENNTENLAAVAILGKVLADELKPESLPLLEKAYVGGFKNDPDLPCNYAVVLY